MFRLVLLASASLALTLLLAYSAFDSPSQVSPQGCRMSYMSPSYIQMDLNASWTSSYLANRYRLLLYREVGWDPNSELRGVPVLFIPGNAGSAHQVRSIASSAARQYYSSPSYMNPYFTSRGLRPLDFFAVDFNEDLSAFHGPTLESERSYSEAAIEFILSKYPPETKIIVMGHSMGGIVAISLLTSLNSNFSAVITMSTPHSLPPARFDSRMGDIYAEVQERIARDSTPILSVCGGITDTMIPSEFCSLPVTGNASILRKTVFTSALEGCWSGVGHREMVWCHQVRWRVARAAIEIGGTNTIADKAKILDTWLRDGISLPSLPEHSPFEASYESEETAPEDRPLIIRGPSGTRRYKFPIPPAEDGDFLNFVMYLSQGTIESVSPAEPLPLKAGVNVCQGEAGTPRLTCERLLPSSLKLIPHPDPRQPFPIPRVDGVPTSGGVDESDGVVVFIASVPRVASKGDTWISLQIENDGAEEGWAVASLEDADEFISYTNAIVPLIGTITLKLTPGLLHTSIRLPNLLANVLLVYRVESKISEPCNDATLAPLLLHTSGPQEGHYHRLQNLVPTYLHGHSAAPFIQTPANLLPSYSRGLNITIYTSGQCGVAELLVTVDWWNSFGRWGSRYWNAILAWGSGIVAFVFFNSLRVWDSSARTLTSGQSLLSVTALLPKASILFLLISLLPLPSGMWLGNVGEAIFSPLAPFILFISAGLVCLSWIVLRSCLSVFGRPLLFVQRNEKTEASSSRGLIVSFVIMAVLVSLFIPWQVAFIACYFISFYHCAVLVAKSTNTPNADTQAALDQKLHVLLLMTWCLPVVAPVLLVWTRTLLTAGYTSPFDGDHFILNVVAFLLLTHQLTSSGQPPFGIKHKWEFVPISYFYALGSIVIFIYGPRSMFRTYEAFNWPTILLCCFRLLPLYRQHSFSSPHVTLDQNRQSQ